MKPPAPQDRKGSDPEGNGEKEELKPWRSEGLPGEPSPKGPKINWWRFVVTLLIAYAAVFMISSFFDETAPEPISYTQFTQQVQGATSRRSTPRARRSRAT
ncbi:hypothetical protein ACFQX6_59020 [Streptosporangium lutulentum]